MTYEALKPIMQAVVEGYIASANFKFPPHNPYAICGVYPGEEDGNLLGAAWFFGYWSQAYANGTYKPCEASVLAGNLAQKIN